MATENKTAVEWLVKEFSSILGPIATKPMQDLLLVDAIKKAKELEKQQIIYACDYGIKLYINDPVTSEDYYNSTYGGDNE